MKDLKATDGCLSLWEIDPTRSNLLDVVVACASNRDSIQNVDYILLERGSVSSFGELCLEPGKTPFAEANQWHVNLVQLTARRLGELCQTAAIVARERVFGKEVKALLAERIKDKRILLQSLNKKLAKEFESVG